MYTKKGGVEVPTSTGAGFGVDQIRMIANVAPEKNEKNIVSLCKGWAGQWLQSAQSDLHGRKSSARRIQVCPKKGISLNNPILGMDLDHQSYSRDGSGFLGVFMESNPKAIVSLVLFQIPGAQTESKKKRNKAAERMLPSPAFTPSIATLHCWLVVAPCFFFGGELSSLPNAKDLEAQCNQNSRFCPSRNWTTAPCSDSFLPLRCDSRGFKVTF